MQWRERERTHWSEPIIQPGSSNEFIIPENLSDCDLWPPFNWSTRQSGNRGGEAMGEIEKYKYSQLWMSLTHLKHGLGSSVNDALSGLLHFVEETHGCKVVVCFCTKWDRAMIFKRNVLRRFCCAGHNTRRRLAWPYFYGTVHRRCHNNLLLDTKPRQKCSTTRTGCTVRILSILSPELCVESRRGIFQLHFDRFRII